MVQSTRLGSFGSNTSTVSGNSNVAVSSSLPNIQSSMGMGQSVQPVAQGGLMAGSQLGQGGIGANQNVMGGQGGIGANQNVMGGLGSTAISSAPAMMPTPGMAQQTGVNSLGVTNNSAMNMPIGQHPNGQQAPPKYVKIWEVKSLRPHPTHPLPPHTNKTANSVTLINYLCLLSIYISGDLIWTEAGAACIYL
jgi:mediator of RNA polymerase II transcription subunit 25